MANRAVKTHAAKSAVNDTGIGTIDAHFAPTVVMYVVFGPGTTAGAVQLEASPVNTDGAGVQASTANWVALGAPVAWSAASITKYIANAEGHRFVRARISTAVAGGTIDVYIVTAGFASGSSYELG